MSVKELSDDDIPQYARRCWQEYRDATEQLRAQAKVSLGMWIGGKHQWREAEINQRESNDRPWVSINRCQPAVSQIENEARSNPPGPQAHPVGGGSDRDAADIVEGLIREYEYRSDANEVARIPALRYAAAAGQGCWRLATEYCSPHSMQQRLVVEPIHDPETVFYDTNSVKPCKEDAMWAGMIVRMGREQVIEQYGNKLKILNPDPWDRMKSTAGDWLSDAWGWAKEVTSLATWGGGGMKGPYFICRFWRVKIEQAKLIRYLDGIDRFEDEDVPEDVPPDKDTPARYSPRRHVIEYIVTALDTIKKTEWYGDIIPIFWISGPEVWRDGERHRLSALTGAEGGQRSLNYAVTTINEILGLMSKAPYTGPQGSFDVQNAQGQNPWESSNKVPWAFMEYKPVWAANPVTGETVLAPPPQRNAFEAPIQAIMAFATWCGEAIKAATSVFFEPSLPSAALAQSGTAIQELQSQTNIGTANWQAGLHMATTLEYQQAAKIMRKIYDGPRVLNIVRPDNQHEAVLINREFSEGQREGGKHRLPNGKLEPYNDIENAELALRVTAGQKDQTRAEEAQGKLIDIIKIAPGLMQNPGVVAKLVRIVGQGNPEIEGLADLISPDTGAQSPEQLGAALQQVQSQNKQLMNLVRVMQQAIAAKQPDLDLRKFETVLENLTKIRVAEINASKDRDKQQADTDASLLEALLGQAHDTAMQAVDHQHQAGMAAQQAALAPAAPPQTGVQ